MQATTRTVIGPGPSGRPVLHRLRASPPLGVRLAAGDLYLLGTAAGPLGGDRLRLELVVRSGIDLTVRSVAASVALRGDGTPSSHHVTARVEPGATLRWLPEPLVAAAGCDHHSTASVELQGDAGLVWRDELVLGRAGEQPGGCTSGLRVTVDGRAVLHHAIGTHTPGWDGPAVLGDARAAGHIAFVGPPARHPPPAPAGPWAALSTLDHGVRLAVALADDHVALRRSWEPLQHVLVDGVPGADSEVPARLTP